MNNIYCKICGDFNPDAVESSVCEECQGYTLFDDLAYGEEDDNYKILEDDFETVDKERFETDEELAEHLGLSLGQLRKLQASNTD